MEGTRAQVFSDVEFPHTHRDSTGDPSAPYKARYLQQSIAIRDTISFSYEHGAASLLDFLNAQSDYRQRTTHYLNLGRFLSKAANQLILPRDGVIPMRCAGKKTSAAFCSLLLLAAGCGQSKGDPMGKLLHRRKWSEKKM